MSATAILVHGGWSGAWSWWKLTPLLDERGIGWHAVDLPTSRATDATVGPLDDVAHVHDAIDAVGGPVVLLGNSYGGVVISGVDHPAVVRLVYLAAQMPAADEPILGMLNECACPAFQEGVALLPDGRLTLDVDVVVNEAYRQATHADHEVIRANLAGAMSFGTDFAIAFPKVAWEKVPATYVVCADDRATQPEFERRWAKARATDWEEWPSDHCPQVSDPQRVVDLLARLVRE